MNSKNNKYAVKISDLKENEPKRVTIDEEDILLIKSGNQFYAYGNSCPHYGAPLTEGYVSGREITCPLHNARFSFRDGKMITPPALDDLTQYEISVKDDEVIIGSKLITSTQKPARGKESETYIIVGGGAAGNAAAETLRKKGFQGKVTLITSEKDGPYDRTILSKEFIAGSAEPEWLPLRSPEFYSEHSIDLVTDVRVTDIDTEKKYITTAAGDRLRFDKCLLATGARDASLINAALDKAGEVLIAGAGFIGLEIAASLQERGIKVRIAAPGMIPMVKIFGEEIGLYLKRIHEEKGIIFHLGNTISEFRGNDKVNSAVLSDGQVVKTDLVIIAVGVKPAVEYLKNTHLLESGAVAVNSQLMTKADSVFAAGDIAAVPHPFTSELYRTEHWVVAERQGLHAAKSMLGDKNPYKEVPFFWTRQYERSLKFIGYNKPFDRIELRGSIDDETFLTGYYSGDTLNAAASMGMGAELNALERILALGNSVTPEQFRDQKFDFSLSS